MVSQHVVEPPLVIIVQRLGFERVADSREKRTYESGGRRRRVSGLTRLGADEDETRLRGRRSQQAHEVALVVKLVVNQWAGEGDLPQELKATLGTALVQEESVVKPVPIRTDYDIRRGGGKSSLKLNTNKGHKKAWKV